MTAASFLQNMAKEKTEKGLDMTEDRKRKNNKCSYPPWGMLYKTYQEIYIHVHVYNLKIMKFIIQTKF